MSPVGDEPAMRDWAAELVERARSEGVELTGDNGLLTALVRQVLQTGLEVEMTDHLGYEPHAVEGRGSGNNVEQQGPARPAPRWFGPGAGGRAAPGRGCWRCGSSPWLGRGARPWSAR